MLTWSMAQSTVEALACQRAIERRDYQPLNIEKFKWAEDQKERGDWWPSNKTKSKKKFNNLIDTCLCCVWVICIKMLTHSHSVCFSRWLVTWMLMIIHWRCNTLYFYTSKLEQLDLFLSSWSRFTSHPRGFLIELKNPLGWEVKRF